VERRGRILERYVEVVDEAPPRRRRGA
jgi:hypothetical protein